MSEKRKTREKDYKNSRQGFLKKHVSLVLVCTLLIGMLSGICTGEMRKVQAAGTAADAVSVAASQVGYHEKASNAYLDDFAANSGSANYTKYARDLGITNGQPWCTTFLLWCMKRAGVPDGTYPYTTWVPTMKSWFENRGLFRARGTYTPKPGDFIIFGSGAAHVGIVESVSGNYVHTIEGNTSGNNVHGIHFPCHIVIYWDMGL